MSIQKVVEELTQKKKAALESAGGLAAPSAKPTSFLDMTKVPEVTNTVSYLQLFGETLPDGTNPLYPAPPEKWDHPEDIPEADPNWVLDHKTLPLTAAAVLYGHNALMIGPPGTGKTKDVREVCARAKIPYYRFSGMEGLEPADLVGQTLLLGGETKHVDGAIMKAVRHGGVWAYDEPFKTPPGTNMAVQWLAEPSKGDRAVMLYGHENKDEIKVVAHPEFRMFLCDNARGTGDNMDIYAATNVQDASFINRMQYKVRKGYMDYDVEVEAIQKIYPWVLKPLAERMVRLAGLMRQAWEQGSIEMPFTFRELETWSEIMSENDGNIKEALFACYGNMLEDGDEKQILGKAILDVGLE